MRNTLILLAIFVGCSAESAANSTGDNGTADVASTADGLGPDEDVSSDTSATTDTAVPDDAQVPDVTVPDVTVPDGTEPDAAPLDATGGDDSDATTSDTSQPPVLHGPCDQAARVGGFVVEAQDEYSIVDGKVASGVVPTSVAEVVSDDGTCRLLKRRNLFCDPPCGSGETCGDAGACISFPTQLDLGTVTITGLEAPVSLTAKKPGNNYFDTSLPHPAFDKGAIIGLASTGATVPAFALTAVGVDNFSVFDANWTIDRGHDLAITWPASDDTEVEVEVRLTIDQHGSSPVTLVCRFPDTGTATIPSTLTDALLDSGVSGFPNGRITRRTADSATISVGCVDLVVSSPRDATVRVAGVTPCKKTSDCPSAQTCNVVIELCE